MSTLVWFNSYSFSGERFRSLARGFAFSALNLRGVSIDSVRNIYVCGEYANASNPTNVFSESSTVLHNLPLTSGGTDAFVTEFNSLGEVQYSILVSSSGNDLGYSLAKDSFDNVYIGGQVGSGANIIFRSSANVSTTLGTLPATSGGTSAVFSSKFNSAGALQYSLFIDGTGSEICYAVTCDSLNNLYIGGQIGSGGANIIFRSNSNVSTTLGTLPTGSAISAFASKFNSAGALQYSLFIDGSGGDDIGYAVTCDSLNNLYIGGQLGTGGANIIFRSNSNVSTTLGTLPLTSGLTLAVFVSKFNSAGALQYSLLVDSSTAGNEICYSVACDSLDNLYIGGQYFGTPNIIFRSNSNVSTTLGTLPASLGGSVGFVSKFNSSGALQYSLIIDSTGNDAVRSVICDSLDNLYIGGTTSATPRIIFRSNSNVSTTVINLTSEFTGAFFCKFDSSGNYQFTRGIETASDSVYSIACDSNRNTYVVGDFNNRKIFDQNSTYLNYNVIGNNNLSTTVTLLKFDENGNTKIPQFGYYLYSRIISTTSIVWGISCDTGSNVYMSSQASGTSQIRTDNNITLANVGIVSGQAAMLTKFSQTGTYQYTCVVDAVNNDLGYATACDYADNVYLAGIYNGTPNIRFNNSSNVQTTLGTLPASTANAAFATKFNSTNGALQYSLVVDSAGNEIGYTVACDSFNNMYIGGSYLGTPNIIFRSSANVSTTLGTLPVSLNATGTSAFASKFNSAGALQYSIIIDSNSTLTTKETRGVACDASDNVYISGGYNLAATIRITNSSNVTTTVGTLPSGSGLAGFASKFNSAGTLQYTLSIDSTGTESSYSVACDTGSNVYVCGVYNGTTPSIRITNSSNVSTTLGTLPTSSAQAGFISKFNSSGVLQYSLVLDATTTNEISFSIACDKLTNNVFVSGQYGGTPTLRIVNTSNVATTLRTFLAASGLSAFMLSFDGNTGNVNYVRTTDTVTNNDIGYAIACDSTNNVYTGGQYNGAAVVYTDNGTTIKSLPNLATVGFMHKFQNPYSS